MTNLADLLPAGGGQNNTEFVADGNISSGAPVILTSAGTVSGISETAFSNGSPTAFSTTASLDGYPAATYDPNADRIVVIYRDANDGYLGKAVVGEISGNSVTYGTPSTFSGSNRIYNNMVCAYYPEFQKIAIVYADIDNSSYISGLTATVDPSDNSITFGTVQVGSTETGTWSGPKNRPSLSYDSVNNKFLLAFLNTAGNARGMIIDGTNFANWGFAADIDSGSTWEYVTATFDSNVNKWVIAASSAGSNLSYLWFGSVSSYTFSSANQTQFLASQAKFISLEYISSLQKSILVYQDEGNSNYGTCNIVDSSAGSSFTVGTATTFATTGTIDYTGVNYTTGVKALITYEDGGNSNKGTAKEATIDASGNSVTFSSASVWSTSSVDVLYPVYDPDTSQVYVNFLDGNNSGKGSGILLTPTSTNLTSTNLLGIASGAISDTATGTINTWGSRNEVQTGLTIGSDYYVQEDGTIAAGSTSIAYDISALTYTQSFSVASQDTDPTGLAFNTDGTKMFVVGNSANAIHEYALSTGFDISTASFTQSFSVASQSTAPSGIAFKPDGTIMFVAEAYNSTILQYALSSAFDVSSASYTHNFNVASQEADVRGVAFNSDGTVMLITGIGGDDVNEYALSSAYDVSSASFTDLFSIASQETNPQDLLFNSDGTTMWIVGDDNDALIQYTLTSGFDVSTASYTSTGSSLASQDTSPMGAAFNSDGTKLFVVGQQNDAVYQYATTATSFTTDHLIGKAITATQINIKDYTG